MRPRKKTGALFVLATCLMVQAHAAEFELSWVTIDDGGGASSGAGFVVHGTIGQPDAGVLTGGGFELTGGFWSGAIAGPSFPGDCDEDGDVDLYDYFDLEACLSGPGGDLGAGCECFDSDGDGDNDLGDFAEFQADFTGS